MNLDWYDYGARFYDPALGRWHVPDPMVEKHYDWTSYAYTYNNPVLFIDEMGLDTNIFVFDQAQRPLDDGTDANTYTAQIYVVGDDGTVLGVYDGSSYPNSVSAEGDNSTVHNTVSEGEHSYNNETGHEGGTEQGLNIDDSGDGSRTTSGKSSGNAPVIMTYVNVHEGYSNNGNYNSRGSEGCITIKPSDTQSFFSNFDWSSSGGVTGKTKGTVTVYRGSSGNGKKNYLNLMKSMQNNWNLNQ